MKRYVCEMLGTFIVVLFGCSSVAFSEGIFGLVEVALVFGLAYGAMYYALQDISGAHFNPAVSLATYMTGRLSLNDFWWYTVSQIVGAILASGTVKGIIHLSSYLDLISEYEIGQNGYGIASAVGLSLLGALVVEFLLSFTFIIVWLGVRSSKAANHLTGLVVGLTITFIYIVGLPLTGAGINPARSIGPAMVLGGLALRQLWVFIIAPFAGAAIAALFWNFISKELV